MMEKRYWNEAVETLDAPSVAKLESERLRTQIPYMYATSPFFAAKLDEAGVRPESIRHRADLARIPFGEKKEIADSQRDGALIGANQCAPIEKIVRIQATGGTTGQPLRIAYTRNDNAGFVEQSARALWAMGCRPGDVVFECMNYNLYVGGVSDHMGLENVGAAVIPFGVGSSKRLLEMMLSIAGEVAIWSTPSYAVRLAEVADEEGIERDRVGLRKGFFSGEPGIQVPGYRARIEGLWGMRAMDMYGTSELGMHCGECPYRNGVHYGGTGIVLTELIDPDSAEPIPFEEGASGEFVYTSLEREASPLLRMRSHDMMQVFTEPCGCGRSSFRFKLLGRSDDMFIVKGVNVFPLGVQAALSGLGPRLTGEFQIILEQAPPIDKPVRVRVEVAREVPESAYADLIETTRLTLSRGCNFNAAVELAPQGTIASERKTRRLYRVYAGDELPRG